MDELLIKKQDGISASMIMNNSQIIKMEKGELYL